MERRRLEEMLQFVDHVLPRTLCWGSPGEQGDLWVFSTEEEASNHTSTSLDHHIWIRDKIKTALLAMNFFEFGGDVLVQFWAATTMTDEGVHLLTTSDQPFALNRLTNENLNHYKKKCPKTKLVDEEEQNPTNGSISRVFRTQLPEMSLDVRYYTVKEYPELELALEFGFKSNLVLPVFGPSLRCVGVLELLLTEKTYSALVCYASSARTALSEVGLGTLDPWQIQTVNLLPVMEELKAAMAGVRETHHLPFVNIWGRFENISPLGHGGSLNRRGELLIPLYGMEAYDPEGRPHYYLLELTHPHPLRMGHGMAPHGPVDKVFHSDKPCFCRDVTQLSLIDYPIAHIVRWAQFKSCFVVCLQSDFGNRVYAIEFFLPPDNRHGSHLYNFLSSILRTLNQYLERFKVVADQDIDDFFTHNTLNTSSGHETTSSSYTLTDYEMISSCTPSGQETTGSSNTLTDYEMISSCTPSGHETTSSSYTLTDYEMISSCTPSGQETESISSGNETTNISSGHETVHSIPLSVAFAQEQIRSLRALVQQTQARIDQLWREVDEYEASSQQRV